MIFGGMGTDPVEEQILAAIKATPGINRKDLHRALGNHVKAAVLVTILARLRDAGRVRVEEVRTGGRPAEWWFPCDQQGLSSLSSLSSQEQQGRGTEMEVVEI